MQLYHSHPQTSYIIHHHYHHHDHTSSSYIIIIIIPVTAPQHNGLQTFTSPLTSNEDDDEDEDEGGSSSSRFRIPLIPKATVFSDIAPKSAGVLPFQRALTPIPYNYIMTYQYVIAYHCSISLQHAIPVYRMILYDITCYNMIDDIDDRVVNDEVCRIVAYESYIR